MTHKERQQLQSALSQIEGTHSTLWKLPESPETQETPGPPAGQREVKADPPGGAPAPKAAAWGPPEPRHTFKRPLPIVLFRALGIANLFHPLLYPLDLGDYGDAGGVAHGLVPLSGSPPELRHLPRAGPDAAEGFQRGTLNDLWTARK
jgi:hypothetical protein